VENYIHTIAALHSILPLRMFPADAFEHAVMLIQLQFQMLVFQNERRTLERNSLCTEDRLRVGMAPGLQHIQIVHQLGVYGGK